MKASPIVTISALVAVATGGFLIGRISSPEDETAPKTTEATRPDRSRPGDRIAGNSDARGGSTSAGETSGKRMRMAEKLLKMESIMRGENPLDRSRA